MSQSSSNRLQTIILSLLAIILMGVIFIIDINTPLGMAIGAIYCVVILYSWIIPGRYSSLIFGIICSILIFIPLLSDTEINVENNYYSINRAISLIVVWTCLSMMTIAKYSFGALEKIKRDLDKKVELRTMELTKSEASLNEAQKLAKIGSWEWYPDTNKVVWSDQMYQIFEIEKSDHSGFVHDIFQFIHPDDIDRVKEISEKAIAEKRAIPIEYRIISKNKNIKYIRGGGDQVIDNDGNLVRLFGTLQDITDEVKQQSEFNAFWNNSLELMCIADVSGKFIRLNPKWEETLGYEGDELIKLNIIDLVHPDDKGLTEIELTKIRKENKNKQFTNRLKTKSNNYCWLNWTIGYNSDIKRLYCTIRDVSDDIKSQKKLKDYAKTLEQKNSELEQFVYIASHDLQEPLRTVMSMSEMLEEKYKTKLDERADKLLQFITQASSRMSALVKGLMDYSRIGKEKKPDLVNCDLLINEVQKDLQTKINETDAIIEANSLPEITGYEMELRLLFQNLISNAIKFRKPDVQPKITISATKENDFWVFSFKDNGIGIADEHKERIFTIFQRLHNKNEYEGTGIGLSHCQKIVNLHGGKIWVESKLGKGSTFFVSLPI